jgi:addiction module HigA family antidote
MEIPSSPSAALRYFLSRRGITAYQLSQKTIIPQSRISEILSGRRRITADTATILGDFFGNGAEFWSGLQASHDLRKSQSEDATRWEGRGDLNIGGWLLRCYVTPDEQRLISSEHLLALLGFKGPNAKQRCVDLINSPYLQGERMAKLRRQLSNPTKLVGPEHEVVYAYDGSLVIDYCRALMDVRRVGGLPDWAAKYAEQAELIVASVAKVGIAALIDEATGHQSRRHREALQRLLSRYFKEEYAAWTKRFPDWFYEELFRLKGWQWNALSTKRPSIVGKVTKDIVYSRLEAGVLEELENRNPLLEGGKRKTKHHQWLSDEVGHPALDTHFYALRGLMRASIDWRRFYHTLQLAFPKQSESVQLELDDYVNGQDD